MKSFRTALLAAALLVTPAISFSQSAGTNVPSDEKVRRNSITLDVTGLLHQFTSVSGYTPFYNSPYFLVFHRQHKKNALRLSIGGTNNGMVSNPADSVENTTSNFSMALGVGLDRMRDIGKNFQLNYGVEAGFQYSDSKSRSEYSTSVFSELQVSTGAVILSPFLGLFWNLHPRFAIGTETCIRWSFSNSEFRSENQSMESTTDEMRFNSTFHLPVSLMARLKF